MISVFKTKSNYSLCSEATLVGPTFTSGEAVPEAADPHALRFDAWDFTGLLKIAPLLLPEPEGMNVTQGFLSKALPKNMDLTIKDPSRLLIKGLQTPRGDSR